MPDRYRIDREERERRMVMTEQRQNADEIVNVSLLGLPRTLRKGPRPAWDICGGVVFRTTYEQCVLHGEEVWILSPVHGLLDPDATIQGVGMCLEEMKEHDQVDWAADVIGDLIDFYEDYHVNVKVFASPTYVRAFKKAMALDELVWNWAVPEGWIWTTVKEKLSLVSVSLD